MTNKKCDSEPQAVKEGIIWPAWQLRSNPPMAVSPRLPPGQLPHVDRHRCAFTGRKGLSQSCCLCSYLHSEFSILQGLTENIGCSPASKFLSLLGGGFLSSPQYNKLVVNNKEILFVNTYCYKQQIKSPIATTINLGPHVGGSSSILECSLCLQVQTF